MVTICNGGRHRGAAMGAVIAMLSSGLLQARTGLFSSLSKNVF